MQLYNKLGPAASAAGPWGKVESTLSWFYVIKLELIQVNPLVNAIVQTAFAKALDEASRIDELMKEDDFDVNPKYSAEKMPYLGVPITVKEIIFVKVITA